MKVSSPNLRTAIGALRFDSLQSRMGRCRNPRTGSATLNGRMPSRGPKRRLLKLEVEEGCVGIELDKDCEEQRSHHQTPADRRRPADAGEERRGLLVRHGGRRGGAGDG